MLLAVFGLVIPVNQNSGIECGPNWTFIKAFV